MKPSFYDTHVHFPCGDGEFRLDAVLERAAAAGVTRVLAVGADAEMNRLALEAARRFPGRVAATAGLERGWAEHRDRAALPAAIGTLRAQVRAAQADGVAVAAMGEMGLDYHYSPESAPLQCELFEAQLALAREFRLPAIVHSRDADEDTLVHLVQHASTSVGAGGPGVLHCFTGTQAFAERLLALGYYISFSGILTFRNADPLRAVAARVPEDRLLIETDSPYLAPVPVRGRRNEPAFLPHVAACLAKVRNWPVEQVAEVTTRNARRLFGV